MFRWKRISQYRECRWRGIRRENSSFGFIFFLLAVSSVWVSRCRLFGSCVAIYAWLGSGGVLEGGTVEIDMYSIYEVWP